MKRTLNLPADLWAAFDRAAEVRGSHEAVLRYWLSAGGVFESKQDVKTVAADRNAFNQPFEVTRLDATGIDRSSKTGKASLETVRRVPLKDTREFDKYQRRRRGKR